MASDRKLHRGALHTVERIGDTVRRPVNRWTPAVHGLLKYLAEKDFYGVPRLHGVDDVCETLSWNATSHPKRPNGAFRVCDGNPG